MNVIYPLLFTIGFCYGSYPSTAKKCEENIVRCVKQKGDMEFEGQNVSYGLSECLTEWVKKRRQVPICKAECSTLLRREIEFTVNDEFNKSQPGHMKERIDLAGKQFKKCNKRCEK